MTEITMPRLAEEMEEGTIVRWLKADGDRVTVGDELVEIETDKATTTYEAELAGVLTITAGAGATVAVGQPIATLSSEGEPAAAVVRGGGTGEPGGATSAQAQAGDSAPASQAAAPELPEAPAEQAGPAAPEAPVEQAQPTAPEAPVEQAQPAAPAPPDRPAPSTAPAPTETAKGQTTITEPTRAQGLIARRMAESRATVPSYTLRATIDMRACVELRASLEESAVGRRLPTIGDIVVKATANALARNPRANGAYRDGRFEQYARVNVGIAVDTGEALVAPTIFDADRKRLGEIAEETHTLVQRAREGSITPPELAGGTFTVSNLGTFGVRSFEAIITPPQAAILAVGALEPRPVARDGEVVVREQLDVELSCDHRILLGAEAARLLRDIRALLEEPLRMAL